MKQQKVYFTKVWESQINVPMSRVIVGDEFAIEDSIVFADQKATDELDDLASVEIIKTNLSEQKKQVIDLLTAGYNWHNIAKDLKLKNSDIYRIKNELQKELAWLKDANKDEKKQQECFIDKSIRALISDMSFYCFIKYYILDYDITRSERKINELEVNTSFVDWESSQVTVSTVTSDNDRYIIMCYLIRFLYLRHYPVKVNYYYSRKRTAEWLFFKFRKIIRANPILGTNFDLIKSEQGLTLLLADGSSVKFCENTYRDKSKITIIDNRKDQTEIIANEQEAKIIVLDEVKK